MLDDSLMVSFFYSSKPFPLAVLTVCLSKEIGRTVEITLQEAYYRSFPNNQL